MCISISRLIVQENTPSTHSILAHVSALDKALKGTCWISRPFSRRGRASWRGVVNVRGARVWSVVSVAAALTSLDLEAQVRFLSLDCMSPPSGGFRQKRKRCASGRLSVSGVKKQACEARKCLRMSRQREEADPMPKKRAKGTASGEWEKPSLLQDLDILGEVQACNAYGVPCFLVCSVSIVQSPSV